MSDPTNPDPGNFFNATPEQQELAAQHAVSYLRDTTDEMIERVHGRTDRVAAIADSLGTQLTLDCISGPCPVLSEISMNHSSIRHKVANAMDNKEEVERTLEIIRSTDAQNAELLGLVMDRALRDQVDPDVVEAELDYWEAFGKAAIGGGELSSEREVIEQREEYDRVINEGVGEINRLEELHGSICPDKRGFIRDTAVAIRRTLKIAPKDGDCNGVKYNPSRQVEESFSCTSTALEPFYAAIDDELITLHRGYIDYQSPTE